MSAAVATAAADAAVAAAAATAAVASATAAAVTRSPRRCNCGYVTPYAGWPD